MPAQDDAIEMLEEDHHQVERLFRQYKAAHDSATKRLLAQQVGQALRLHTRIEEEVFYPAVARATGEDGRVQQAEQQHHEALELVQRIDAAQVDDKLMLALEDAVLRHIQEERDTLFPAIRQARGVDLAALARQLHQRKFELVEHA